MIDWVPPPEGTIGPSARKGQSGYSPDKIDSLTIGVSYLMLSSVSGPAEVFTMPSAARLPTRQSSSPTHIKPTRSAIW